MGPAAQATGSCREPTPYIHTSHSLSLYSIASEAQGKKAKRPPGGGNSAGTALKLQGGLRLCHRTAKIPRNNIINLRPVPDLPTPRIHTILTPTPPIRPNRSTLVRRLHSTQNTPHCSIVVAAAPASDQRRKAAAAAVYHLDRNEGAVPDLYLEDDCAPNPEPIA